MSNQPSTTPESGRQEKVVKIKPEMPGWERRARVIYTLVILAWLATAALFFGSYIIHYPIPFVSLVFVMPLIMCFYLRSGRRGWLGAIFVLLVSKIVFFGVLPTVLALFIGTPGTGFIDRYLDWVIGVDQGGGLVMMLTARAAIIFSVGIFLVVARLLQYQKISQFQGKGVFKATAIGAVLLPLLLMTVTSSGETNADPAVVPPAGVSFGGAQDLLVPDVFQTSRVFDQSTGTWTYSIFFSNPTQVDLTVTQVWAGRDAIAPLGERVVIDGSGISISDGGIVFGTGCSGTIQFSTTQGHNTVTVITGNGARYTFSWSEQL